MKRLLPLLLLLFPIVNTVLGQDTRSGNDYAYLFYVSEFNDRGWPDLPETKTELTELARELRSNYGFEVELISNPTKTEILDKITSVNRSQYGPNDQVLFFFSGHGYFQKDTDQGFLIPADGKLNDQYAESWISYDDLGRYITHSKSQHVLLGLDACYSGAFGDRYKARPGMAPWEETTTITCEDRIQKALRNDSRLYFTSGSRDQRTPARSLFARRWLSMLRQGSEKGVLTSNDLVYYLNSIEQPKPEGGSFSGKHKDGDFIFVHKNACSSTVTRQPSSRTPIKKNTTHSEDKRHWNNILKAPSSSKIRSHLDKYPGCPHYTDALNRLTKLAEQKSSPSTKPKSTRPQNEYVKKELVLSDDDMVQNIFTDYLRAVGGVGKLQSIFSHEVKMSGNVQGTSFEMIVYTKGGNKSVIQTWMEGIHIQSQVYNNGIGANIAFAQALPIEGEELEDMRLRVKVCPELHYKEYGYHSQFAGIEYINGIKVNKVIIIRPNGTIYQTDYYDVLNKFKIRSVLSGGEIQDMGDFENVNGIVYPHTTTISAGEMNAGLTLSVVSIRQNVAIDDSFFAIY